MTSIPITYIIPSKMAEMKTKVNDASVEEFLSKVEAE